MKKQNFKGSIITFNDENPKELKVNASEMVKPFEGKKVADFMRLTSTIGFIQAIVNDNIRHPNIQSESDLVKIEHGVDSWMHRLLAYKLAAWLSYEFDAWMVSIVDEVLHKNDMITITDYTAERLELQEDIENWSGLMRTAKERIRDIDRIIGPMAREIKNDTQIKIDFKDFNKD